MVEVQHTLRLDSPAQTMDVSPDGRWLVTGQAANQRHSTLTLWQVENWQIHRIIELDSWLLRVRFMPDSTLVYATAGLDAAITWMDLDGNPLAKYPTAPDGYECLTVARRAPTLAAALHQVIVFDGTYQVQETFTPPDSARPQAAFFSDGNTLALTEMVDDTVQLYGLRAGNLTGAPRQSHAIDIDPADRYLALIERYTNGVFVWDLSTNKRHLPRVFNETLRKFWCMAFHGDLLALGNLIGYTTLYHLGDGDCVLDERQHLGRVWEVKFSPDGKQFYSTSEDSTLNIWRFIEE